MNIRLPCSPSPAGIPQNVQVPLNRIMSRGTPFKWVNGWSRPPVMNKMTGPPRDLTGSGNKKEHNYGSITWQVRYYAPGATDGMTGMICSIYQKTS